MLTTMHAQTSEYSGRGFLCCFHMWGGGTVLPLDIHRTALGHLEWTTWGWGAISGVTAVEDMHHPTVQGLPWKPARNIVFLCLSDPFLDQSPLPHISAGQWERQEIRIWAEEKQHLCTSPFSVLKPTPTDFCGVWKQKSEESQHSLPKRNNDWSNSFCSALEQIKATWMTLVVLSILTVHKPESLSLMFFSILLLLRRNLAYVPRSW